MKKVGEMVVNNSIYHYGIKGMKWGVRRYQNKDGTLTNAGRKRYQNKDGNNQNKQNSGNNSAKSLVQSVVEKKRNQPISKSITGAGEEYIGYALGLLATMGVTIGVAKISDKLNRNRKRRELEELNKVKDIKSFDEAPKLSKKMPASESMKVTNPDLPAPGTTMNCTYCTTAMALREKGFDVKAGKVDDGAYSDDLFKAAFNSPEVKMSRKQTASSMLQNLANNGEGSYGNLRVQYKMGGAHSVFWKVENGKTHIYDGQNGKEYTESNTSLRSFTNDVNMSNLRYNRLDNCEPTEYALAVVERMKK